MITEIRDTSIPTLIARIVKGLDYCNATWQQMKVTDDLGEYRRLSGLLDAGIKRLHTLVDVAQAYGLDKCVFGTCKFSEDKYFCFGCTEAK